LGAVDVIFKPIDREILRSKVRAFVDLHESRRELSVKNAELQLQHAELTRAYAELRTAQAGLIQAAKMASLGALVAGVAHEINNPLAFVMSHVQTAIKSFDRSLSERAAGRADSSEAAWQIGKDRLLETQLGLERMNELVVKLRTFSRLDEGERKSMSVQESISAVLTILNHRFKGRIEVELSLQGPDRIDCFPALFNQVLLNLLSNAADAIGERGVIEIATHEADGVFELRVKDSGPGLSEATRQRLFEPFFTTKGVGEGTGLGLAISYAIVQKHGGTIELSNAPGGGAVALVRVPLTFEPQPISEPPLEDEAAATKSFSADVRAALHAPSSNK
jgi:two-component system NtrC family sensor kinase